MIKKDTIEMEKALLHRWFEKKYWGSCCEDEAIEWSQHQESLSLKEIAEYTAWKEDYLKTVEHLIDITGRNTSIYYACKPWTAKSDNVLVKVVDVEKQ